MNATLGEGRPAGTGGAIVTVLREIFTNWRLALLGVTGLILSIASGWTTWDGMSNFTCPKGAASCFAPGVLSFMVTFGIQGIMLIAAWFIGETFAASASEHRAHRAGWFKGGLLAAASLIVVALVIAILTRDDLSFLSNRQMVEGFDLLAYRPGIGAASLIIGIITLAIILSRREIVGPYIEGAKTVLRNIPLWIMFLACMATSVFFSFDSLFSTIFPQKERVRAAKLRVENQVAGVLSNVQTQLVARRLEATRTLFASSQWQGFDQSLDQLVTQAESAPEAVQKQKLERVARSNQAQAELRGQIAAAEGERIALAAEKTRIESQLETIAARRTPDQAKVAQFEQDLITKKAEIVTATTAAEGERKGVRGTGNAGAGPEFRKLRKIVQNLELDADEIETRLNAARARLAKVNEDAAANQHRLVGISKRTVELEQAKTEVTQRQAVLTQSGQNVLAGDLDAAGGVKALDVARNRFRRAPEEKGLDQLEQLCTSLLANLRSVPSLKTATANVNCEPGDASVLANAIFRIRASESTFQAGCVAGAPKRRSTDSFLRFGSDCIRNSGLRGTDTEQFRDRLNRIALNRDDEAHRFVVSWNAFTDGNALAYLALAIAIAIDGLVFMSGLFGANVIRSPLSAVNENELERIIDNALGDNKHIAVTETLNAIEENKDPTVGSYCHQVSAAVTDENENVARVLAAGRDLGVVRWDGEDNRRHLVHADFNKILQQASSRHRTNFVSENSHDPKRSRDQILDALKPKLLDALQPHISRNAAVVLNEIQPDSSRSGFMGFIIKPTAPSFPFKYFRKASDASPLQRSVNVGTSEGLVATDENRQLYFVRPLFFTSLNEIRAANTVARGKPEPRPANVPQSAPLPATTERAGAQPPLVTAVAETSALPLPAHNATIDLDEQDRRSSIRVDVRQSLIQQFQLDELTAKHLHDDANIADDTLRALKTLPGIMAETIVPEVETMFKSLRDSTQPIIDQYDIDERLIAEEERNTIALAEAARRSSSIWRQMATSILERYIDIEEVPTEDRPFLKQDIDDELRRLKGRVLDLQSHDRFDRELIALISDADHAWYQLQRLEEDMTGRPEPKMLHS